MTATDELRQMLDERGVEWWEAIPRKTKWHSPVLGGPVAVSEWNGKMVLDAGYVNVTPEQAIAATLRAETCKADETDTWTCECVGRQLTVHVMECSACGGTYEHVNGDYEFCPRCGAKVVDE